MVVGGASYREAVVGGAREAVVGTRGIRTWVDC